MASLTGPPSPSSTRPSMRTRSPDASGVTRLLPGVSAMAKYGPTVCEGVMPDMSGLGRCLVAPAQHDVEFVRRPPIRLGGGEIEARDHPRARFLVPDRVEDRIVGHQRVAREIHLGDE